MNAGKKKHNLNNDKLQKFKNQCKIDFYEGNTINEIQTNGYKTTQTDNG